MTLEKRFYLETNALYSISKIKDEYLPQSFTSALAIFEIISGLKPENYNRSRAILKTIQSRKLQVVWSMPEHLVVSSFDALIDYEFVEFREKPLLTLLVNIINHSNLESLIQHDSESNQFMGFKYFQALDSLWNRDFIISTESGNVNIRRSLLSEEQEPLEVNGILHPFDSIPTISDFFRKMPAINEALSINEFATGLLTSEMQDEGITEEIMYKSYNMKIAHFITAYTKRVTKYMTTHDSPRRNDFVDLLHLLYLSNSQQIKIVSDDNLYDELCPHLKIPIEELKN